MDQKPARKPEKDKMTLTILSYSKDGTMDVEIDGIRYIYFIEAGHIETVIKKAKKSKGAALNFLKAKARDCRRVDDDDAGL